MRISTDLRHETVAFSHIEGVVRSGVREWAESVLYPYKGREMRGKNAKKVFVLAFYGKAPMIEAKTENIGGNNEESKLGNRCDRARFDGLRR